MKRILVIGAVAVLLAGAVWLKSNWGAAKTDYLLARTDFAISRTRSWRMHLETTDPTRPKERMVIEAIPPDREHGWQHVDRDAAKGNLEYVRIRNDRYFKGDAMFGHEAAPQWIKLIPRDFPPLDGFFELRFHMSNPRTVGYSFDSIETSFWSNYYGVNLRPEGLKTYSGHSCHEWSYSWTVEEIGKVMHDTLCIGATDYLPYHLTISDGWAEVTYEWNPQISIEAPSPVVARPKGFISALPNL